MDISLLAHLVDRLDIQTVWLEFFPWRLNYLFVKHVVIWPSCYTLYECTLNVKCPSRNKPTH